MCGCRVANASGPLFDNRTPPLRAKLTSIGHAAKVMKMTMLRSYGRHKHKDSRLKFHYTAATRVAPVPIPWSQTSRTAPQIEETRESSFLFIAQVPRIYVYPKSSNHASCGAHVISVELVFSHYRLAHQRRMERQGCLRVLE